MAPSFDVAFGHAAVKQRLLTSEQVGLGTKIQKVLAELSISKPLAAIAVEAGWLELDAAMTLVTGLRKLGIDHPEVRPRPASDADEAVLDRISPQARKRLETASRNLAALFYARPAGTLALDQGSPTPAPRKQAGEPPKRVAVKPPPVEIVEKKSGALGAILAAAAAVIAVVAFLLTRKGTPTIPEPEPPPPVVKKTTKPAPPAPPAPTPPKKPTTEEETETPIEPTDDPAVAARRKEYIEKQEGVAAKLFEEIQALIREGRPVSARTKLRELVSGFSWTEFVKTRKEQIARLTKETEEATIGDAEDPPDSMPTPEEPLPVMTAAVRRLDDEAAADARRAVLAKSRLAGWKSDLLLRGGKVVKGAEVLDISREDFRARGEIDGTKVDLLLAWNALDAGSLVTVLKQIARGQSAAGAFEMGRIFVQCRQWEEARAAFDECAKIDAAWKPRLPDLAAILSDPAVLRTARRTVDGRLMIDYSSADPEQAAEFVPAKGTGTVSIAGPLIKFACKEEALWRLKDLEFDGEVELSFEVEGSGEVIVSLGPRMFRITSSGFRDSSVDKLENLVPNRPITVVERPGTVRVLQDGKEIFFAATSGRSRLALAIGAKSDAAIRNLRIVGLVTADDRARRLGPLERLEGGARIGDFQFEPGPLDPETRSRSQLVDGALDAGLFEDAWNRSEEALSRTPTGALAIASRGLVRLAQGEMRLAIQDADLAMAIDPCRGEVSTRARRITAFLRGPAAVGAFKRRESGPWDIRTDATDERLGALAGKLDALGKQLAEMLKDTGVMPKGVRVTLFASRDAAFTYLETADPREAVAADGPGADGELLMAAAAAYIRTAAIGAPGWLEAGLSRQLSGIENAPLKGGVDQALPLDALVRKNAVELRYEEGRQAASFVRYLLHSQKGLIPDLLNKLKHGVPAMEVFSGKDLKKIDQEWRAFAAKE